MAISINDKLSKINQEVADLKKNADTAAQKVRTLGDELKLDPKNVKTMQERLTALNEQVKLYGKYQDALRLKQQKLQQQLDTQKKQKESLKEGTEEYRKLESQIKRTSEQLTTVQRKITAADNTLTRLSNTTRLYNKELENTNKQLKIDKLKKYNEGLNGLQQGINKLQVKLLLLLGTIAKITKEAIAQGTELYTLSKRYKTSAENIQLWNKALQLATGDNDLFTESLKTMSKGLSTIPVGRGVAYNNALRAIGVSFKDIQDLDPSAQFQTLLNGLQSISNESLQGSYALTLFGESGQTIVNALRDGDATMEQYLERAKAFVAYTSEDTKTLTELGFQLDIAKVKLQRATVELAVNATPVIVGVLDILRVTALPLLKGLTSQTWVLKTAFGLLIALIVTKGLIAFAQLIIQIRIAAAEQKKFLMWTLGAKAAILGLVGVVGVIATVGAAMASVNSQIEDFSETVNDAYGSYGNDLSTNVTQTATAVTERTLTVNVEVDGRGDTPISDENAMKISQLTIEGIQKQLGDLVK